MQKKKNNVMVQWWRWSSREVQSTKTTSCSINITVYRPSGAEFTRHADVTFYPGNQRLLIVQTARGLDDQNYLNVETRLEGGVPFVPPGATIQIEPFSETYQYYPSCKSNNGGLWYSSTLNLCLLIHMNSATVAFLLYLIKNKVRAFSTYSSYIQC